MTATRRHRFASMSLSLLAALDTTDGPDETLELSKPVEQGDTTVVERRSTVWERAWLELRSDGDGPFRVHVDSRHTHAALKAIDTPLTLVRTHMPSLEDAYLEIVGTVSE